MSAKNYPRIGSLHEGSVDKETSCDCCSKPIKTHHKKIYRLEIQIGYFRGDDEIYILCCECGTHLDRIHFDFDHLLALEFERISSFQNRKE